MSRLQQAEHSLARRVRASLTEVAGSTNGGGRPGRRSACILAAGLSSYARRARFAHDMAAAPPPSRCRCCAATGDACRAALLTKGAGC